MGKKIRSIVSFCFYASLVMGCMGIFYSGTALAKVSGPCSDCHTMHNSQDGTTWPGNTVDPNRALTIGGCVGCHTATTNENTGSNNTPYVLHTAAPTYGPDYSGGSVINNGVTLAGGDFYWVATAGGGLDAKGHNVVDLAGADAAIGQTPPGYVINWGTSGVGTDWAANRLTCAGTYGCHGKHSSADDFTDISGSHHEDDSTIDGTTVGKSYRFLYKILGVEMNEAGNAWEFQPTADKHNQYKGYDRTSAATLVNIGSTSGGDTISFSCGECHGDYHSGALVSDNDPIGTDPWLRHPSDYDMMNAVDEKLDPADSEYYHYGDDGLGNHVYDVIAPVARANPAGGLINRVFVANDDAIVSCLSCHRAHGTPYDDLLRWNYADMIANTTGDAAGQGCFVCHTTKDGV